MKVIIFSKKIRKRFLGIGESLGGSWDRGV